MNKQFHTDEDVMMTVPYRPRDFINLQTKITHKNGIHKNL
jgi:hypothetical protein